MNHKIQEIRERHRNDTQSWDDVNYLLSKINQLQRENQRMEEALGFYAEKENYLGKVDSTPIHRDVGRRARSTLKR